MCRMHSRPTLAVFVLSVALATACTSPPEPSLEEVLAMDDEMLRATAEQGNAEAQYVLGGKGVDAESVRWLRLAAGQGHSRAQYRLAASYELGMGLPQDPG